MEIFKINGIRKKFCSNHINLMFSYTEIQNSAVGRTFLLSASVMDALYNLLCPLSALKAYLHFKFHRRGHEEEDIESSTQQG